MTQQPSNTIGPYVVGERPIPLQYTYEDGNGNPLNLVGYAVKFVVHEQYGSPTTYNAALVNGVGGVVGYTWTGVEFPTPGHYRARFWVGNGAQRFASWLVLFDVADPEGPVPNI